MERLLTLNMLCSLTQADEKALLQFIYETREMTKPHKKIDKWFSFLLKLSSIGGKVSHLPYFIGADKGTTELLSNSIDLSSAFDRKILTTIMLSWS